MLPITRRSFVNQLGGAALGVSLASAFADEQKPSVKPIKLGQIGVGHAHASKLGAYRRSSEYEVVGIVEPDADLRKRAETQAAFKDLKWLTREQLLNTKGTSGRADRDARVRPARQRRSD